MDETLRDKHREYLKNHKGCRYLEAKGEDNIKQKWKLDYKDEDYNENINLNELNDDELVIEFDENPNYRFENDKEKSTKEQRLKWIKKTLKKLKEDKISYKLFDHKGKCPHIHTTLSRNATKEEKEAIIKFYVPKSAFKFVDLTLCSNKHLIATPYAKHYKYGTYKLLIKEYNGE